MKHAPSIIGLALLCAALTTAGEKTSTITNVRYNVQPAASRVTMRFEGPAVYTLRESGSQLIVGFSRTRVASPPGAARLVFQSGFVKSVVIDRLPADSARVVLTFVEGARWTVHPAEAGHDLVVEVTRAGAAVSVPAPAPVAKHSKIAKSGPGVPAGKVSSLVDIPAIARNQVASDSAPRAAHPAVTDAPAGSAGTSSIGSLSPWALAGAVLFVAAAGIGVLLLLAGKRQIGITTKTVIASIPQPIPQKAYVQPNAPERVRRERDEPEINNDGDPVENTTQRLARSFRKGEEEMVLVAKLRSLPDVPAAKKSMKKSLDPGATPSQRMNAAKKLGVGTGEVDLALQLLKYSQKNARKEGAHD